MNELYDDDGVYLGICHTHGGVRPNSDWREVGCQHETCIHLRTLPESDAPMWNIARFKQMNELGQTDNEMRKEIIGNAEASGVEIEKAR